MRSHARKRLKAPARALTNHLHLFEVNREGILNRYDSAKPSIEAQMRLELYITGESVESLSGAI